jgi:hypothetical protein
VWEDIDGDGTIDLGFQWTGNLSAYAPMYQFPGDSRSWAGVYRIERDGFKSLLPFDRSFLPDGMRPLKLKDFGSVVEFELHSPPERRPNTNRIAPLR